MTPTLEETLAASIALVNARKAAPVSEDTGRLFIMPRPAAPPPDSEIPAQLSPSSINAFLDCSARWYYRKILKLPEERSEALVLGTAVHAGLVENFRQKIDSHVDMGVRDTQAVFIRSLCDQRDEGVKLPNDTWDDIKEAGEIMTQVYMEQAAPQVQPAAVEEHVEGEIGGVPVHGYIDIRTTDGRIIDLKTSKRKPAGVTPAHRLQVATYVILHPEASGLATLSTLTKTKTVALHQATVDILPPDLKLTEKLYSIVRDQMHTGLVVPNRGSYLCGKHCSFRGRCLDDYGGVMPAEEL